MWTEFFQSIGAGLGYIVIGLLCGGGIVLSALSISGTWLVLLASVIAVLLRSPEFPGWGTVVVFALLSGLTEGVEAMAGAWGVTKRGGSKLAGAAAIVGGLVGILLGGLFPVPIVGSVLGLLIGSFVLAFVVERRRLKRSEDAAHIAWGAVIARLLVMFVKLGVTVGMILWLLVGSIVT